MRIRFADSLGQPVKRERGSTHIHGRKVVSLSLLKSYRFNRLFAIAGTGSSIPHTEVKTHALLWFSAQRDMTSLLNQVGHDEWREEDKFEILSSPAPKDKP